MPPSIALAPPSSQPFRKEDASVCQGICEYVAGINTSEASMLFLSRIRSSALVPDLDNDRFTSSFFKSLYVSESMSLIRALIFADTLATTIEASK